MKWIIEWILAGIGAILCIGGAAFLWSPQAASNPPGVSIWPMPGLLLIGVTLLGLLGFAGIAYEPDQSASRWVILTWITCGGLLGLSIFGEFAVSAIALLGVPALFFGAAAIIADGRKKRKMLPDFGILIMSGIVAIGLLFAFIIFGR
jgi:hypothetical protein